MLKYLHPAERDGDCAFCDKYVYEGIGVEDEDGEIFCDIHCLRCWREEQVLDMIEARTGEECEASDIHIVVQMISEDFDVTDEAVLRRVFGGPRYGVLLHEDGADALRPKPVSDKERMALTEAMCEIEALPGEGE